jgi:hypothetical protein
MSSHFDGTIYDRSATGTMMGSFNLPLNAPTSTTPALRRRTAIVRPALR